MHQKLWNSFHNHKVHNHGPIDYACYKLLEKYFKNGVSLETGAGLSTLFFAMHSQDHYSISPTDMTSLNQVAIELGISFSNVKIIKGLSDQILPRLSKLNLDFIFIDGGHEFPVPMIDWYYTYKYLKKGGYVGIDDIQLKAPYILHKFLLRDKHWKLVEMNQKTSIFEKLKNYDSSIKGWVDQSFDWDEIKLC